MEIPDVKFLKELSGAGIGWAGGGAPTVLTWGFFPAGAKRSQFRGGTACPSLVPLRRFGKPGRIISILPPPPVPHFFVPQSHARKTIELEGQRDWRLSLGGEVEKPLTVKLRNFRRIGDRTPESSIRRNWCR